MTWLPDIISKIVRIGGVEAVSRRALNFVAGSGVTISTTDDEANNATNVTIGASGGVGGPAPVFNVGISTETGQTTGFADAIGDGHAHFPSANSMVIHGITNSANINSGTPKNLVFNVDSLLPAGKRLSQQGHGHGLLVKLSSGDAVEKTHACRCQPTFSSGVNGVRLYGFDPDVDAYTSGKHSTAFSVFCQLEDIP